MLPYVRIMNLVKVRASSETFPGKRDALGNKRKDDKEVVGDENVFTNYSVKQLLYTLRGVVCSLETSFIAREISTFTVQVLFLLLLLMLFFVCLHSRW